MSLSIVDQLRAGRSKIGLEQIIHHVSSEVSALLDSAGDNGICTTFGQHTPASSAQIDEWNKQNAPHVLPDDLAQFLMVTNGCKVAWSMELTNALSSPVGCIELNAVESIKSQGCVAKDVFSVTAFAIAQVGLSDDLVVLLLTSSGQSAGIWLQEQHTRKLWPIARSFNDYLRLMLVHIGVFGWQKVFSQPTLPTSTAHWLRLMAPERLAMARRLAQDRQRGMWPDFAVEEPGLIVFRVGRSAGEITRACRLHQVWLATSCITSSYSSFAQVALQDMHMPLGNISATATQTAGHDGTSTGTSDDDRHRTTRGVRTGLGYGIKASKDAQWHDQQHYDTIAVALEQRQSDLKDAYEAKYGVGCPSASPSLIRRLFGGRGGGSRRDSMRSSVSDWPTDSEHDTHTSSAPSNPIPPQGGSGDGVEQSGGGGETGGADLTVAKDPDTKQASLRSRFGTGDPVDGDEAGTLSGVFGGKPPQVVVPTPARPMRPGGEALAGFDVVLERLQGRQKVLFEATSRIMQTRPHDAESVTSLPEDIHAVPHEIEDEVGQSEEGTRLDSPVQWVQDWNEGVQRLIYVPYIPLKDFPSQMHIPAIEPIDLPAVRRRTSKARQEHTTRGQTVTAV